MGKSPKDIVKNQMYDNDSFSKWLGIEVLSVEDGDCVIQMQVRDEMLNGFGIGHGGITYAFADSALAFASNSIGLQAVSIESSISHTSKVVSKDVLTATTQRISKSRKFAIYNVSVHNQDDVLVASFKGTVYFTGKEW